MRLFVVTKEDINGWCFAWHWAQPNDGWGMVILLAVIFIVIAIDRKRR